MSSHGRRYEQQPWQSNPLSSHAFRSRVSLLRCCHLLQEKRLRQQDRDGSAGAGGEQMLARSLARRCPGVPVLHNRRAPRQQGNINHIAFAPTGVYVIDCKRHRGKIKIARPLFGPARLMIDGRNRSQLVAGLARHVAEVRAALAGLADDLPVHGCFCFMAPEGPLAGTRLPLVRTLSINGYPLYTPRPLAQRLKKRGPLTRAQATNSRPRSPSGCRRRLQAEPRTSS